MGARRRFPVGLAVMAPVVIACGLYAFTASSTVANPDEEEGSQLASGEEQPSCAGPCIVVDADPETPGLQRTATAPSDGTFAVDVWIRNVPAEGLGSFNFTLLYDASWLTADTPETGAEIAGLLGAIEDKAWGCSPPPASGDLPEEFGAADGDETTGDAFISCFSAGTPARGGDFVLARVPFAVIGEGRSSLHLYFVEASTPDARALVWCDVRTEYAETAGGCFDAFVSNDGSDGRKPSAGDAVEYTGNAEVDGLIDALLRGDAAALDGRIAHTQLPCSYDALNTIDLVPCQHPEVEGDIVDAFINGTCQLILADRSENAQAALASLAGWTLHAVYAADFMNELPAVPDAEYSLILSPGAPEFPEPALVTIAGGRVASVVRGCMSAVDYARTWTFPQNFLSDELRAAIEAAATPTPDVPAPVLSHGAFHHGAWVRVNAGAGDCLNARSGPSMAEYSQVVSCLPHGFEGMLAGGAMEADGHWWWNMAGAGYVAEEYLEYLRDVDPLTLQTPVPGGRIAFVRGHDVWIADSAGLRKIVERQDGVEGISTPQDLTWSPDGSKLSYTVVGYYANTDSSNAELHVVDVQGVELAMWSHTAGGGWSADGRRIAIVRDPAPEGMGSGWEGLPGWIDLTTGEERIFGSDRYWLSAPAFNHDGTLLLMRRARYAEPEVQPEIVVTDLDGQVVHRFAPPADASIGDPFWAPDGNRIAFHFYDGDGERGRYVVYDIAAGAIVAEAELPPYNPNIGGKCGGGDMLRIDWSPDGRRAAYNFSAGFAGTNGIRIWDVATGGQRALNGTPAVGVTWGDADTLAYGGWGESSSYVFIIDVDGGAPRLLTEGSEPVWWRP